MTYNPTLQRRKHAYFKQYKDYHNYTAIWSVGYKLKYPEILLLFETDVHFRVHGEILKYPKHRTFHTDDIYVRINGPTWGDLYKAANEAIVKSGNFHHIYIERFRYHDGNVLLQTGS